MSDVKLARRLATGIAGGLFASICRFACAADAPAQPAPAVLVQPAEMRALDRKSDFIGHVESLDKVEVRARVTGVLGPRKFQDGDRVKAGQVLFEIEREPFEAALDQREAQLAQAQAALVNAEQQLRRAKILVKTKAMSESQVDQLTADQLRALGQVKEGKAALELAKINLSYTSIASPIDGRIGRATVTPGNLVGPDSGVLATVVRDDEVRVLFSVSQKEILEARRSSEKGSTMNVRLKLADGSFFEQDGKIDFLDVIVDPRTDGQILRATFKNNGRLLTDGQTVRVIVQRAASEKSVAVPQAAIASDQSGPYVFVVNDENKVEQRRVKLGIQSDGFLGIEDGVRDGERVIVQGLQRARPGATVAPQSAPAFAK
ncbi:MAG: efflux RND transporter periplasmic adaptor subunit [Methylocystis sp.]